MLLRLCPLLKGYGLTMVILPAEANAGEVMNTFLNIFKNVGIPLSARKTEGLSHVIEYLGIYLDTVKMEARLPRENIVRIQAVIEAFTGKTVIKLTWSSQFCM
jgi:hypothetical protein